MEWNFRGNKYRAANSQEIKALQDQPGAPHVLFACSQCGCGTWSAKNIALSNSGGYNGSRNIFYNGDETECNCPPHKLVCIVECAN